MLTTSVDQSITSIGQLNDDVNTLTASVDQSITTMENLILILISL